jgi:hypothetical protein
MTAATLTRNARSARSAYPTAVEDLIPQAREYAAELGTAPTRNQLMKRFRVGGPKAKALLASLATEPPEPQPALRPIVIVEDETQQYYNQARLSGPASAPAGTDGDDADRPVPLAFTDTRGPEFAEFGNLFHPAPQPAVPAGRSDAPADEPARSDTPQAARARASRYGMGALLTVVGVLLAGVIVAPIALSSQDIIAWAGSATGLGLTGPWPLVTFFALDAAAAVCVGLVVYCAWRGESAGVFAWLVWTFAGMSAYANYSHSTGSTARDAVWFFPAMSLAGPFLLEIIVRRVRRWVQEGTGQRARHAVSFGIGRWIPGVGALRETYGAWRLARLDGINDADQAVTAYRRLCPTGSIRVLSALRTRDQH